MNKTNNEYLKIISEKVGAPSSSAIETNNDYLKKISQRAGNIGGGGSTDGALLLDGSAEMEAPIKSIATTLMKHKGVSGTMYKLAASELSATDYIGWKSITDGAKGLYVVAGDEANPIFTATTESITYKGKDVLTTDGGQLTGAFLLRTDGSGNLKYPNNNGSKAILFQNAAVPSYYAYWDIQVDPSVGDGFCISAGDDENPILKAADNGLWKKGYSVYSHEDNATGGDYILANDNKVVTTKLLKEIVPDATPPLELGLATGDREFTDQGFSASRWAGDVPDTAGAFAGGFLQDGKYYLQDLMDSKNPKLYRDVTTDEMLAFREGRAELIFDFRYPSELVNKAGIMGYIYCTIPDGLGLAGQDDCHFFIKISQVASGSTYRIDTFFATNSNASFGNDDRDGLIRIAVRRDLAAGAGAVILSMFFVSRDGSTSTIGSPSNHIMKNGAYSQASGLGWFSGSTSADDVSVEMSKVGFLPITPPSTLELLSEFDRLKGENERLASRISMIESRIGMPPVEDDSNGQVDDAPQGEIVDTRESKLDHMIGR